MPAIADGFSPRRIVCDRVRYRGIIQSVGENGMAPILAGKQLEDTSNEEHIPGRDVYAAADEDIA